MAPRLGQAFSPSSRALWWTRRPDRAGFEYQPAGFGVNRDGGKPGKEAVTEEAGFASENRIFMEARRHVGEFVPADFNRRLHLWDREFRQTDGNLRLAIL